MKTYEQTLREVRLSAIMSGAVASIDGKELTGQGGYWYLDGEKVTDVDAVLEKIEVDEDYVRMLMGQE